jgi:hypothetical protein
MCSKSVNSSVEEIARITELTASGAHSTQQGAGELSRLAADLDRLVGQFHLNLESQASPRGAPRASALAANAG